MTGDASSARRPSTPPILTNGSGEMDVSNANQSDWQEVRLGPAASIDGNSIRTRERRAPRVDAGKSRGGPTGSRTAPQSAMRRPTRQHQPSDQATPPRTPRGMALVRAVATRAKLPWWRLRGALRVGFEGVRVSCHFPVRQSGERVARRCDVDLDRRTLLEMPTTLRVHSRVGARRFVSISIRCFGDHK